MCLAKFSHVMKVADVLAFFRISANCAVHANFTGIVLVFRLRGALIMIIILLKPVNRGVTINNYSLKSR